MLKIVSKIDECESNVNQNWLFFGYYFFKVNCELQHDAAYDTFEIQNDRHQSSLLHTDFESNSMNIYDNETSEFDMNGFNSMDDTNSNYPTSFLLNGKWNATQIH